MPGRSFSGSRRDPPEIPAGAEPALQRPGCVREPAAGTRTGQGGGGEDAGAAGTTRQDQREDVRQAENLFCGSAQFDMVSDADLQGLDGKIVALTAKVQSLQQSCRYMEAELKELSSALTTPEMQKEIQELKKECAGYRERLKNIKAATNHVTPEEKEQVYRERQKYCKEWRKRKRMATELSDAILEGYPKSKKQFFEEVGIETDEDYNVTLPDP
ncbi:PREDICTED: homologous-pairing protein 2 homolog isoform X2 [Colobus angolensis palliatus]|uniref:homologous-pairing protein 2 homolog isoform X2 n=1 Tax=Colobus angolensis palliatus TaxID=336983 RepID=UPI0005F37BB2|nr:PREDICTED: homologous-pairing protein 2 homolog isoform X2 [Colobus angolensis palliatus]